MQLNSFDTITSETRHIYLSPHFDDVVYSCGSTVGMQGSHEEHPLVITVFAGVPPSELKLTGFARKMHKIMGFDQNVEFVITIRRKEDALAVTHLHADYLWLNYPDAIYRGTPTHYRWRRSIFGRVHPGDMWIVDQLARDLAMEHERLPGITWYAPLGMGYHVDHQIVFAVANRLLQHGANVKFYEDFPYVLRAQALQKRLKELSSTLKPVLVEIGETLHLRQEAAEMYDSQVRLNFGDKAAMYKAMKEYTFSIHAMKSRSVERYWTHQSTGN